MQSTSDRVRQVVADLFKCDPADVTDATGPGDLPGWDSLGHVALMAALHDHFGQHIPVEDAIEVASVADLVAIMERLDSVAR